MANHTRNTSSLPKPDRPGTGPEAPPRPERFPAKDSPAVSDPPSDPVPEYPPGDQPGAPGHTPTSPPPVSARA